MAPEKGVFRTDERQSAKVGSLPCHDRRDQQFSQYVPYTLIIYIYNASSYQDRLGTNIGKTLINPCFASVQTWIKQPFYRRTSTCLKVKKTEMKKEGEID
jgi:hypothetical protein